MSETQPKTRRQRLAPWFLVGVLLIAAGVWGAIWWSTRPQTATLITGAFAAGSQEGKPVTAGPDGKVWIHLSGPQYAVSADGGKTYAEVDVVPSGQSAATDNSAWAVPAFDPVDAKARAVGSLDALGRVVVSANGGKTWRFTSGPPVRSAIRSVVVRSGGSLLFVTTGSMVALSNDRGYHWRELELPKRLKGVDAFFSQPGAPRVMLVASTGTGLWRTTNAGQTWSRVWRDVEGKGAAFLADPANAKNVSVVMGGQVLASRDGGATFRATTAQDVTVLARDPKSGRMFALTTAGDVLASTDGARWGRVAKGVEPGSLVASWGTLFATVKGKIATLADRG